MDLTDEEFVTSVMSLTEFEDRRLALKKGTFQQRRAFMSYLREGMDELQLIHQEARKLNGL